MAIPTFIEAGTFGNSTGAPTFGVPATRQLNDILVLVVETANQAMATPTDFTAVTNSPQGTGVAGAVDSTRLSVFWKRSDGTETGVTTADSGDHQAGIVLVIRGAILSGNPIDVTAGDVLAVADTPVIIPGATTTAVNCLILAICSHGIDVATSQLSGWANASLTSVTEIIDRASATGNGGGFGIATGGKATAGAYGATTATLANAFVQGRMSIAIKPEQPPVFNERRALVSFAEFTVPEAP